MIWRHFELPWLPEYTSDFRADCSMMREDGGLTVPSLMRMAQFRLSEPQLAQLAKLRAISIEELAFPVQTRLGLLSNANLDLILPSIRGTGLRYGIDIHAHAAPFDQVAQQALDPASFINSEEFDFILIALTHHALPVIDGLTACKAYVGDLIDALRHNNGKPIIFQTIVDGFPALFGHLDRRQQESPSGIISRLNNFIRDELLDADDYVFEAARLAENVGIENWCHPGHWNLAKLPFSQHMAPYYADHVCRLLGAIFGRSKKCIVLDLDNTLWGGVVGDDGLDGIHLGQHDPTGEAFLDVQRYAKSLRDRGVILAVSSKNDESNAKLPFQSHPEMLLNEEDIAVFQANWIDKASNLEAIAERLNIGIDALVLLDDNPAERAQVRDALPLVGVPELPDDPAFFVSTLQAAGYFEAVTFTDADLQRASQYQSNAKRAELASSTRDLSAYLSSLEMRIIFRPFDQPSRSRIVQLINKSNQFNLTTRRYTSADVAAMESDPDIYTLQVSLSDRFGDNGMICVVICRRDGEVWEIDTWLMSCRVLGRHVEEAVMSHLVDAAGMQGISDVRGIYIPSQRNELVRDHYLNLGFKAQSENELGSVWSLRVEDFKPKILPFSEQ